MAVTTRMTAAYRVLSTAGIRGLPYLPLICIPACTTRCHIIQRTRETFFMPALISSLKTNSRGEIAQPNSMQCLSGFSTKPHFMLRRLDSDTVLRLPSRVGAGPQMSSCRGLTEAKWALWGSRATSCKCTAAVWLLFSP